MIYSSLHLAADIHEGWCQVKSQTVKAQQTSYLGSQQEKSLSDCVANAPLSLNLMVFSACRPFHCHPHLLFTDIAINHQNS
jgi:hypothetical protein